MTKEEVKAICEEVVNAAKRGEGSGDTPSSWAKEAAAWAKKNGIVNGYNDNDMGWQTLLTREQMATVLYRFAQMMGKA